MVDYIKVDKVLLNNDVNQLEMRKQLQILSKYIKQLEQRIQEIEQKLTQE